MTIELCAALKQLQKDMPAVFAGTELTKLTGGGYNWRTLQNEKCLGVAPEDLFLRSGRRKLLIHRDSFLAFWQLKIGKAS